MQNQTHSANWILVKPTDIYNYLAAPQVDILRKRALTPNQSDPLVEIIQDVCMLIRLQLSTLPGFHEQIAPLIPSGLKATASHLIIEALQSRIPNIRLSPDQVRNADNARALLAAFAKTQATAASLKNLIATHKVRQYRVSSQTLKGLL